MTTRTIRHHQGVMTKPMEPRKSLIRAGAVLLVLGVGGCPPPPAIDPFEPIPMRQAVRIVNRNAGKITGTLRALGSVDGYFSTEDDGRRNYHADATLFHLGPCYLRFDFKKFGDRQVLFGCNETDYWFYTKEDDNYYCGHHGAVEDLPADIPIRPDRIGEALGLGLFSPEDPCGGGARPLQRVVDEYQQILCLIHDERGDLLLEKEYWLDRYPPQLVRRVVFRDADGVVELESRLDRYRSFWPDGPLLPREMVADWPKTQAQMRFTVDKWSPVDQVKPGSIQFATPAECTGH